MTTAPTLDLHIGRPPAPSAPIVESPAPSSQPPAPAVATIGLPTPAVPLTQMRARAHRFVQVLVEIIDGDRPAIQLLRMSTEAVYNDVIDRLESLAGLSARGARLGPLSTQVGSVHVEQPRDDCAEISARIVQRGRSRALALRLDRSDGRWVCSAIRWG